MRTHEIGRKNRVQWTHPFPSHVSQDSWWRPSPISCVLVYSKTWSVKSYLISNQYKFLFKCPRCHPILLCNWWLASLTDELCFYCCLLPVCVTLTLEISRNSLAALLCCSPFCLVEAVFFAGKQHENGAGFADVFRPTPGRPPGRCDRSLGEANAALCLLSRSALGDLNRSANGHGDLAKGPTHSSLRT